MLKEKIQKNAIIYLINIILFSLIFISKPNGGTFYVGFLILFLLLSFIFVKQTHTEINIWNIFGFQIVNMNSLTMLVLFGNLLLLHWSNYQIVEKIYLIMFCVIQVASIRIAKASITDET